MRGVYSGCSAIFGNESAMAWTIFVFFLVCLSSFSEGAIYFYKNVHMRPETLIYRKQALMTMAGISQSLSGRGTSFVKLSFVISRQQHKPSSEVSVSYLQGFLLSKDDFSMLNSGGNFKCDTGGLLSSVVNLLPYTFEISSFESKKESHTFHVNTTGMYYLALAYCGSEKNITIDGVAEWVSSYGYLPGKDYGLLWAFSALSAMYFLMLLIWGPMCLWHRKELFSVQFWITGVMMLGLLESLLRYIDFRVWNLMGVRDTALLCTAVSLLTLKKTLCRVLVLLVRRSLFLPSISHTCLLFGYLTLCCAFLSGLPWAWHCASSAPFFFHSPHLAFSLHFFCALLMLGSFRKPVSLN